LTDLNTDNFQWGVGLVAPQDPGNVGTILRTMDAVGASGLILLGESVDAYHPTAVRASMGALFWHAVVRASFEEFARWAKEHGYHVYGSSARGESDHHQMKECQPPAILLLGSEREGLDEEQAKLCEKVFRLPMKGHATSLNLAVAAGVLLYKMNENQAFQD
jgi:TrmH family RNA methyltransferase